MSPPIVAAMPAELDLGGGFTFRFDAVDPTTGATVASVVVSDASIFATSVGVTSAGALNSGPFMLVPGPGA